MITHFRETRGLARHGWLTSWHTFSFANYYNPDRMGFGALRVINDDTVEAGMGFGTHPHRDMEIISIPLEGALQHRDSEGNSSVIKKGEVQIMSAGTGIYHSEFNASLNEQVKFLQIWVLPKKNGLKPRYEQKDFSKRNKKNKIMVIVSPDGREDSVSINQNAFFSLSDIEEGQEVIYEKKSPQNGVYIFILRGHVSLHGNEFKERDGIGLKEFEKVSLRAQAHAEVLFMEVPV
jgi:quercetin 2,3-dioxygenase